MEGVSENTISVIKQNDPNLPEFLDFVKLRREGLEHIGNLSGKIWTDHNAHDPGITILEVLVYALMDLGYRTNIPFKDLIARKNYEDKDDNFLTPLEILTINPVTIIDYRKLLLEIDGVRNAWLEVANQEVGLFINRRTNTLNCTEQLNDGNCSYEQLCLNGLYQVYIEKEKGANDVQLKQEVIKVLSAHRNLCEDFINIKILESINFGVCVDVEIRSGYDPKMIYTKVIKEVRNFIQPEIKYYTLNELLDKGKTIDDVFAGRPYNTESYGFVDTDELEELHKRTQVNLSDLYNVILSIEGIRKIKKIHIKKGNVESLDWTLPIQDHQAPVFSIDDTCIDIYSEDGVLKFDKLKIRKSLSFGRKFRMPLESLDNEVPFGVYHEELADYYSIQNDFPVVYAIGEDGLPESATLERKTQALQLKGYLMFYDQMLANYTSQLANIRSLFSLKPESDKNPEERRTYFTQIPESIPGLEDLLRFYNKNSIETEGAILAYPVADDDQWKWALKKLEENPRIEFTIGNYCQNDGVLVPQYTFPSVNIRSIHINQLIDSFYTKNYTIQILEDRFGCFFALYPSIPDSIVIVGIKRYKTSSEAKNEAKNVAFFAAETTNYSLVTNKSENTSPDQHYFGITANPISYLDLIQELTENDEEYRIRRKQFLDHLLARFGEDFTDYALLQYKNKLSEAQLDQEIINDQSVYINEFSELSRNRGKAFDYLEPSWNTTNVSGFEKRISLLSGLSNYHRRNLCNFEVTECHRIILNDPQGNLLFRGNVSYESKKERNLAAKKILLELRDSKSYEGLEKRLNGFNSDIAARIFCEKPTEENIRITKYHYYQQLFNQHSVEVVRSKNTRMTSEETANKRREEFIKTIDKQTSSTDSEENKEYRLIPVDKENHYLNVQSLNDEIIPLINWKWHIKDAVSKEKTSSDITFNTEEEAWENVIKQSTLEQYLTTHTKGHKWSLNVSDEGISFNGLDCYPDRDKAIAAWRKAKVLGTSEKNFVIEKGENKYRVLLQNEKKKVIATSEYFKTLKENLIDGCIRTFKNRKTKPKYGEEKTKTGFTIPIGENVTPLVSYCVYDSKKEALQEIGKVFELGANRKNYLQSGDEGNPEYNFLLRDKDDSFLTVPADDFETASQRDTSLTSVLRFFKDSEQPIIIKEEPRRYIWTLSEDEKILLKSESEFSSKARARSNFEKVIATEALQSCSELCKDHIYKFKVDCVPAEYRFVYGNSNSSNELNPIFISDEVFKKEDEASKGYEEFIKKLPNLSLKTVKKNTENTEFALYDKRSRIAVQYTDVEIGNSSQEQGKASLAEAKELTNYISSVYTNNTSPNADYIASEMAEDDRISYEWRFYKKNAPIAKNLYLCDRKEQSEGIRRIICEETPPVDLRVCPPKQKVVCPRENKNIYHYQVCFDTADDKEFVLISYAGYQTKAEAEEAWHKEWLEVIKIARNRDEYGVNGKINLKEEYKDPESKDCNEASFMVVIPEVIKNQIGGDDQALINYYLQLAELFPIYKVETDDEDESFPCKNQYKYRVVVPGDILGNINCTNTSEDQFQGSLLWDSEACFDSVEEAIQEYQYFYALVGTPNNCRVLCEKGKFYVGIVEVLAESACDYTSAAEAWDSIFPEGETDSCGDCEKGGLREFIYAAEEDRNFIPICDQQYWKFKIVSSDYFVADHTCWYNSEIERDAQIVEWRQILEGVDWGNYIVNDQVEARKKTTAKGKALHFVEAQIDKERDRISQICEFVNIARDCFNSCANSIDDDGRDTTFLQCLLDNIPSDQNPQQISIQDVDLQNVYYLIRYFPIYKTEEGYCYRLYWSKKDDDQVSRKILERCGCQEETDDDSNTCKEEYSFVSSNCYSCCSEALKEFGRFCELVTSNTYSIETTSKTKHGPYSFQIIDPNKELAYHPQQYSCLQEVEDAIEMTKDCIDNSGMHLLEHILLRPKNGNQCNDGIIIDGDYEDQDAKNCLLPICPDYNCRIDWQPDMDRDDPCVDNPEVNMIHYLPGGDPYSFWATVVLPSWIKRFRTAEARQMFETLLYKEVPALVGLHILWLGPQDMCKFEDEYRRWLEWLQISEKQKYDPDNPKYNPLQNICEPEKGLPICAIADCIKTLKSEPPCPTIPGEQGDCNCKDNEMVNDNDCCLPNPTEGTIFWSCCDDVPDDQTPGYGYEGLPQVTHAESKKITEDSTSVKAKKDQKKTDAKAKNTDKKSGKVVQKAAKQEQSEHDLLAQVRQRKPKYLSNIKAIADEDMQKTKSYERTAFFLQNTPTVAGYVQLVNFFKRYSLQKDNDIEGFLGLLKNATWHVLDKIVLDQKVDMTEKELDDLKSCFAILKNKGLLLKETAKQWNIEDVKSLTNTKSLGQIKSMLK